MTEAKPCHIQLHHGTFALDVDCTLPTQQVLGVWGPSGSGKTSLLRVLAGLIRRPNSVVHIGQQVMQDAGIFVPPQHRDLACVFQDQQLFPHLNVRQNLQFAAQRRVSRDDATMDWDQVVSVFALEPLLTHMPDELSGGQQQRVALARAVMRQPRLLLLDEPMASLDHDNKQQLLPYLRKLNNEFALPMVYVSHQLDELLALSDDLLVLRGGQVVFQGGINQAMLVAETGLPDHPLTAAVLQGSVTGQDDEHGLLQLTTPGGLRLWVKGQHAMGSDHRLIIAANDVALSLQPPQQSSVLNVLSAQVTAVLPATGHDCLVRLGIGSDQILSRISQRSQHALGLTPGQSVFAQIKAQAVVAVR